MKALFAVFALLLSGSATAQTPAAPAPCSTEQHRQFDFWVGTWEVRSKATPDRVAHNEITLDQGRCVLVERYRAGPTYRGMSLSFYDAQREVWHQTWIDNQGSPLYGEGGLRDGSMVLESAKGASPFNRVTWTPNEDGSVRQHWQQSADDQKTWTTVFDGTYTKTLLED